jgi:indolepyruvate decarboxylase
MPLYTVANYIIDRLAALKARHLFAIPGNYNSQFLFAVQEDKRLRYVGTTNELEAGYAADAYSRTERIGVACVTYGVGSFSLYNAIAGAFVERCPVVLINGTANADKARQLRDQGVLFAHAIDTLRTDELIFRPITAATAVITDPRDAPGLIDWALRACVTESRPVYLEVPDGVWVLPCARPTAPPADQPLMPLPMAPGEESDVQRATEAAVQAVLERAREANSPVLWGGEWLQRLRLQDEFEELVALTGWPYTTTLLGKGLISEKNPLFIGVYDSAFAPADVRKVVEGTDCLVALGTILSDFYGPIVAKKFSAMVLAAGGAVRVSDAVYPNGPLDRFLRILLARLKAPPAQPSGLAAAAPGTPGRVAALPPQSPPPGFEELRAAREARRRPREGAALAEEDPRITWDAFFSVMRQRSWKGWRVMVDTSVALFPAAELLIEERDHFIAQTAWLSIGYTTGGAVGSSFAAGEGERVAAFAGDGGFQMVPQTLSTLVQAGKPAVIFVFANGLYAIEQYLVEKKYFGRDNPPQAAFFNHLGVWNYQHLAAAFGAKGFLVSKLSELRDALTAIDKLKDVPALVEVQLDPHDLPAELRATIPETPSGRALEGFAGPQAVPTIAPAAFN